MKRVRNFLTEDAKSNLEELKRLSKEVQRLTLEADAAQKANDSAKFEKCLVELDAILSRF